MKSEDKKESFPIYIVSTTLDALKKKKERKTIQLFGFSLQKVDFRLFNRFFRL